MRNKTRAVLRGVLMILMGATTAMTLLGAVGTTCIAWNADKYGASLAPYIPFQPLFQVLVFVKLAVAVAGAMVTYALIRGRRWFYVGALVTLLAGLSAAIVQMSTTSAARHIAFLAVAPTNIRFYITVFTLIAFLIVRIPGIWSKGGLGDLESKPGSPMAAGGLALFVAGLLILTTPVWVGPSHIFEGVNVVYTLEIPLLVDGTVMVVGGLALMVLRRQLGALLPKRRATRRVSH